MYPSVQEPRRSGHVWLIREDRHVGLIYYIPYLVTFCVNPSSCITPVHLIPSVYLTSINSHEWTSYISWAFPLPYLLQLVKDWGWWGPGNEADPLVCVLGLQQPYPITLRRCDRILCNAMTRHALALCMFMPDQLTNHIAVPQRLEGLNVSLTMEGGLAVTMSFSVSWE